MPMLPPICASRAGGAQDVGDERRGRRLAVGAGDGDERRIGAALGPLAAEQLDVADDLDTRGPGLGHRPVRLGMGQRHARRQHQRGKAAPVGVSEVLHAEARRCGRVPALGRVVGSNDRGAAGDQRRAAASPDRARPNTATVLPANVVTGVMLAVYPELAAWRFFAAAGTTRHPPWAGLLRQSLGDEPCKRRPHDQHDHKPQGLQRHYEG